MFSNQSENQDRRPEKKKRKKIKRLGKTIEVLLDEKKLKRIPEPIKSYGKFELDVKLYTDVVGKIHLLVTDK